MKHLVAVLVALVITAVASPAMAYVVVVTTSIPLPNTADEAQIETALDSAINDVLAHAIAFTPTVVRLENLRVVANRVYLLLLIADADGEKSIETFSAPEPSSAAPTERWRETTPRFTY